MPELEQETKRWVAETTLQVQFWTYALEMFRFKHLIMWWGAPMVAPLLREVSSKNRASESRGRPRSVPELYEGIWSPHSEQIPSWCLCRSTDSSCAEPMFVSNTWIRGRIDCSAASLYKSQYGQSPSQRHPARNASFYPVHCAELMINENLKTPTVQVQFNWRGRKRDVREEAFQTSVWFRFSTTLWEFFSEIHTIMPLLKNTEPEYCNIMTRTL